MEQALGALGQSLLAQALGALGASGPLHQALLLDPASPLEPLRHPQNLRILHLRSERPQRRRHSPPGVLEQALGVLEQFRGGCLALAALGQFPPALLCLLASAPQQQTPVHLAPRTLSEPAAEALEVRDLDLVLAEPLQVRAPVEQELGALGQ